MKSEAVKALEAEIQELSDKMENLAKARALLVYPKEKKSRKPYKKREPKLPKNVPSDQKMFKDKPVTEDWPPKPKKKAEPKLNPPLDPA